jgi:uncharacterized protein (DUF4415 family)
MSGKKRASKQPSRKPVRVKHEKDDAPELNDEWFRPADVYSGTRLVRRGRPAGTAKKTQTTVRISNEVLAFFRASGPGWQTRMDEALKRYVAGHKR